HRNVRTAKTHRRGYVRIGLRSDPEFPLEVREPADRRAVTPTRLRDRQPLLRNRSILRVRTRRPRRPNTRRRQSRDTREPRHRKYAVRIRGERRERPAPAPGRGLTVTD